MKRALIVAFTLIMCGVVSAYAAQDLTGKHAVGIATGGIFPKDDDIDNNWYIGGNYTYSINNNFAVGAEAGYMSWEDEVDGLDFGDVRAIPLLADLYLRYPVDAGEQQMFLPYIIGGIGAIFWDYDESSLLESVGLSVEMDAELGIKGGLGFDYFFSEQVALNLEGSYVWSDADMTVSAAGLSATGEFDADYWAITGGIKYNF